MEDLVPFEIATCEKAGASKKVSYPLIPEPGRPFHPFRIQRPFWVEKRHRACVPSRHQGKPLWARHSIQHQ